jgi:membrane protein
MEESYGRSRSLKRKPTERAWPRSVVLLMWLYLSAYIVLVGAELNSEMEHQTARDTTRGEEQPMGQRGAQKAYTVGESP